MIMAIHLSSSSSLIFPLSVLLLLSIFCLTSVSSSNIPEISYSDHCSSYVSESTPTQRVHHSDILPYLSTVNSYYHGGDSLWTRKSPGLLSNTSTNSLTFQPTQKSAYRTEDPEIFKLKAYLTLRPSYVEDDSYRYSRYGSYGWSYYAGGNYSEPKQLSFLLSGYFSESSGKLCMVGSASWYSKEGKPEYVEAVLRLSFAEKNSNISNGFVNGSLQSLRNDSRYFEEIKIFAFTDVESYKYSLASKDLGAVCKGRVATQKGESLSVLRRSFCSAILENHGSFELEHAGDCKPSKNCSPVDEVLGYSPRFMILNLIQCSDGERKVRFMVKFQNTSYADYYRGFNPNSTFVGEGSWDDSKNQFCIVACRILNLPGDGGVGDCSLRLSLRYPAVWTIRNAYRGVGEIWTNKTAQDSGYFQMMKFRSTDHNMNGYYYHSLPGLSYKYTETERVTKQCPSPKAVAKDEEKFPDGNSRDMRLDISVQYSKEQNSWTWGNAIPIFAGDELAEDNNYVQSYEIGGFGAEISEPDRSSKQVNSSSPLNMSYLINFGASYINFTKEFASLNLSLNSIGQVEIVAEGIYHGKNGHLCMVGCRKLEFQTQKPEQDSQDCEILVEFDFPSVNARRRRIMKGSIRSTRKESDPLYFALLNITSNAYYSSYARESIWRMDLEIIMVLISNTLACIFIALQLFYAKRHPEMLPFMSLLMLVVLTLGHMIPLVLNFEALFLSSHQRRRRSMFGADGWIEVNEVIVRVITMVAFLLQARLLQLAWSAKWETGNGNGNGIGLWLSERKTVFVSFPMYIAGGLLTILVKWMWNRNLSGTTLSSPNYYYSPYQDSNPQSSTWGGLRSYAGFILDGFLFPQVLFNIFHSSREGALSRWFYMGTTLVRLLPHAYDLYRVHNYAAMEVEGSYLYANPRADFYSTAWDIVIPCLGMLLAVIIWLQQRFGGRCVLPRRFRDSVAYEKVVAADDDSSA
nr:Cytidylate kinase [Ipomoea batatas]